MRVERVVLGDVAGELGARASGRQDEAGVGDAGNVCGERVGGVHGGCWGGKLGGEDERRGVRGATDDVDDGGVEGILVVRERQGRGDGVRGDGVGVGVSGGVLTVAFGVTDETGVVDIGQHDDFFDRCCFI